MWHYKYNNALGMLLLMRWASPWLMNSWAHTMNRLGCRLQCFSFRYEVICLGTPLFSPKPIRTVIICTTSSTLKGGIPYVWVSSCLVFVPD